MAVPPLASDLAVPAVPAAEVEALIPMVEMAAEPALAVPQVGFDLWAPQPPAWRRYSDWAIIYRS